MRFISSIPYLRLTGFTILLAAFVIGCSQQAPSDPATAGNEPVTSLETVNENCPIMGGKVSKEATTVQRNGRTIGFCCDGCDKRFMALSDGEKSAKLTAAAGKAEDGAAHRGHDHS